MKWIVIEEGQQKDQCDWNTGIGRGEKMEKEARSHGPCWGY